MQRLLHNANDLEEIVLVQYRGVLYTTWGTIGTHIYILL
jgi:hypothetical protein